VLLWPWIQYFAGRFLFTFPQRFDDAPDIIPVFCRNGLAVLSNLGNEGSSIIGFSSELLGRTDLWALET
jgi:hypothetical protein